MKNPIRIRSTFLIHSITIAGLVLLSLNAISQNTFSLNAHAGLAGTQVQGDGLGGFDKIGFMGGIGVNTEISTNFDLGFEMNFVQKGSIKRPNPEAGDYIKYKMSLGYIQVPIYLKYHVTEKISFTGGPAIGVLISSKEEDMNGEIPTQIEFNKFELALILGASYNLSESFEVGVRLDQSLLPIRSKGDFSSNTLIGKQYNTALGIYLYYSIR